MRAKFFAIVLTGLCAGLMLVEPSSAQPGPGGDLTAPPGVDVQARGPVHEAFGEPTQTQSAPGLLITKQPPQLIEELPPEEKPQGDNIVWIPGYWSYDTDANDFLWISGFWRAVPPGRTWMPGHWQQVSTGYRWVAGYWGVPAAEQETEYLPPPPATIDAGPSVPAPGAEYSYVPGTWVYQTRRYAWRPGYWLRHRPGWVWVSACYRWTPSGYVFVPGYWDMPLLDRGLLFAPVRFDRVVIARRGFVYRPSYVIQPDFLCGALFVRTGAPCYYFGDYFAAPYRRNYVSWVNFRVGRVGFDINFNYYRHSYAKYPDWERNLNTLYVGRYNGTIGRPPVNLVQQTRVINNYTINKTSNVVVHKNVNITNVQNVSALTPVTRVNTMRVTAMSSLAANRPGVTVTPPVSRQVRVERMSRDRLAEEQRAITRYQALAREHRTAEAKVITKAPTTSTAAPVKVKVELPRGTPPPRVIRHSTPAPAVPRSERHERSTPKPPVKPGKFEKK